MRAKERFVFVFFLRVLRAFVFFVIQIGQFEFVCYTHTAATTRFFIGDTR